MGIRSMNPKHPVYIVSKNRSDSMLTSRALCKMKVPHFIVIEPQNESDYKKAIERFNLHEFVKLIIAPFSNHGDGPGRARNYAWDHALSIGAEYHWVMDDNITDFFRLHNNVRIRVADGTILRAAEDFVERYENVPLSGLQYYFFAVPGSSTYKPFIVNTRIYSCLLIRNDCVHRWRGRYNEDTDLSLRVLKDGDCTIEFIAFLQGKMATQVVKGGNTEEFYHNEGDIDKLVWRDGFYNPSGTIKKSQMLYDMHPDVTEIVWKYGRVHHYVDYSRFKNNILRLKPGLSFSDTVNDYGMKLITNYEGGK